MANILAADVTHTVLKQGHNNESRRVNVVSLAFGDGVLTYPTGGVPLTKAKMGLATHIESLSFMDEGNANGFVYKYDRANEKIRIYQGDNNNAADAALIELVADTATPALATLVVNVTGY